MGFILKRDVDNLAFVAVHRLEDDLFAAALHPPGQPYGQLLQRFFSALAVVFYVQHDEMARFFALISRQVRQILKGVQRLAVLADEDAQVLAVQVKDDFIGFNHLFDHHVDAHVAQHVLQEGLGLGGRFFSRKGFLCRFSFVGSRLFDRFFRRFLRHGFGLRSFCRLRFRRRCGFPLFFFNIVNRSSLSGLFRQAYLSRLAAKAKKAAFRFGQYFDRHFFFHQSEADQAGTDCVFYRFSCRFNGSHAFAPFPLLRNIIICWAHWNTLERNQ